MAHCAWNSEILEVMASSEEETSTHARSLKSETVEMTLR